jgi:hypothetical protein
MNAGALPAFFVCDPTPARATCHLRPATSRLQSAICNLTPLQNPEFTRSQNRILTPGKNRGSKRLFFDLR